ncbi:MAG: class I SAM-dependent methyltransferase [Bacteroidales bacterium]|nr:class I SAM-dependent methyltransferase [Bacteroidales bacterium]
MQLFSNPFLTLPENIVKPEIFPVSINPFEVHPGVPFRKIYSFLKQGKSVCLTGTYGFALGFYSWLKKQNDNNFPVKDYQSSRANREALRLLNKNLLIGVYQHYTNLENAPDNAWLKVLYPQQDEFLIRFSDFLGMNGAWQWYSKGIQFPTLNEKVHPFYGVYFPTRHEHLALFDSWLAKNTGFTKAIDIGTGCGVLALMMLKHGIPFVHATDVNPNAVYSAKCEVLRRNFQDKTVIEQASLTGSVVAGKNDLIVFNPPWIPAQTETEMDAATYYEPGFFEAAFDQIDASSVPGSTLVMLFSNFAQVAGISNEHPIEEEVQNKTRFLLIENLEAPVMQAPSSRKSWLSTIRQQEKVELWIMKKNGDSNGEK